MRKVSPYLLVWEGGLDHGSLKAVRPLELCLLPQGLEGLHRAALYGQRFCKQALQKRLGMISGGFSLRCYQRASCPHSGTARGEPSSPQGVLMDQWAHNWIQHQTSHFLWAFLILLQSHISEVCGSPRIPLQWPLHDLVLY